MKEDKDIEFLKLSDEDLKQFNRYKKNFFYIYLCIFIVLVLPIIEASINENFKDKKNIVYIFCQIIFTTIFIWNYIKYFLGKPVGIRYGYVSKKISDNIGKYKGFKVNIHFRDIDKTIYKKRVHINKNHNHIKVNDKVGVIKTKLGYYFIFPL